MREAPRIEPRKEGLDLREQQESDPNLKALRSSTIIVILDPRDWRFYPI